MSATSANTLGRERPAQRPRDIFLMVALDLFTSDFGRTLARCPKRSVIWDPSSGGWSSLVMPKSAAAIASPEASGFTISVASTLVVAIDSAIAFANSCSFEPKYRFTSIAVTSALPRSCERLTNTAIAGDVGCASSLATGGPGSPLSPPSVDVVPRSSANV